MYNYTNMYAYWKRNHSSVINGFNIEFCRACIIAYLCLFLIYDNLSKQFCILYKIYFVYTFVRYCAQMIQKLTKSKCITSMQKYIIFFPFICSSVIAFMLAYSKEKKNKQTTKAREYRWYGAICNEPTKNYIKKMHTFTST